MINKDISAMDEWVLKDIDSKSLHYGKSFKFSFECFKAEKIKKLIKSYVWINYQSGTLALSTISGKVSDFKTFNAFANQKNIFDLKFFDENDADDYRTYLKMTKAESSGMPLTFLTQKSKFNALRSIVYWGQTFMPELVPVNDVFCDITYSGRHIKHKIDYIPNEVLRQINSALINEENPYIKYGIIILLSTGMRRSELLNLEIGCVTPHLLNGYTLTMYDFKNRKQVCRMPINDVCAKAIEELERITNDLRQKADEKIKKYLFLYQHKSEKKGIKVVNECLFKDWINGTSNNRTAGFVYRHNIRGNDGEIYRIKIQQFRKTVATDMFSKNVDLKIIQEFLHHVSPETTKKYYADDRDVERAKVFEKLGVIGDIKNVDKSMFETEEELLWFKDNKDGCARMCDGYCTKPIKNNEICERLLKHQKCYTCNRYITTPEYLNTHKEYLADLEMQLKNNIYGSHYAAHLIPTIEVLKDIVKRLEAIEYGE